MKFSKEEQEWVKANRLTLVPLLERRLNDYVAKLIDETDEKKSELLKMFIKEAQALIVTINNICDLKDKKKRKKDTPEFTGV
jgi:hypothetical protein